MKKYWLVFWGGITSWVPIILLSSTPTFICIGMWCLLWPGTFWQKAFILVPCLLVQLIAWIAGAFFIYVGRQF